MLVLCQKLHIVVHITDNIFPVTAPPLRRFLATIPPKLEVLELPLIDKTSRHQYLNTCWRYRAADDKK